MKTLLIALVFITISCGDQKTKEPNEIINKGNAKVEALDAKMDSLEDYKKMVLDSLDFEMRKAEASN